MLILGITLHFGLNTIFVRYEKINPPSQQHDLRLL